VRGRRRRSRLPATAIGLLLIPVLGQATEACDRSCLSHVLDQYLTQVLQRSPHGVPLATDLNVRENTVGVGFGEGIWRQAKRIRARQDLVDAASGNAYSTIALELNDARILQVSQRLKVRARRIVEIETVVGGAADEPLMPPGVIPEDRRAAREELLGVANGYFEALGTLDRGAARLAPGCVERDKSGSKPCLDRLEQRLGQQAIERRFPLAIPELGLVIGYAFVMHHERTPPEDDFINIRLRVEDGHIVAIESIHTPVTAPGRSGFEADFPAPPVLRGAAPLAAAPVREQPAVAHFPGYWRLRALWQRLFPDPPQPQLPTPPYPGIEDARDIAYGPDPQQRLDILAPSRGTAEGRRVLVFVHGGDWQGGDKHFAGDILYENVAYWAAEQGMVAVNLNYRLADYAAARNLYPTQEQDIAAAIDWIGVNIGHYGGDPQRIFLWGHSSGGSAIAGYASDPMLYGASPGIKGIFLLSSPLDPTADEQAGRPIRYFGSSHQQYLENAPLRRLLNSDVPVLIGYSPQETEMAGEFQQAIRTLCDHGRCPTIVMTHGTHDGEIRAVGSADRSATDALLAFMAKIP